MTKKIRITYINGIPHWYIPLSKKDEEERKERKRVMQITYYDEKEHKSKCKPIDIE